MKYDIASLAYLAGLIDGEGCINIERCASASVTNNRMKNPHFSVRITIANTDRAVLEWVEDMWGGHIYRQPKQTYQPVFSWITTRPSTVRELLIAILPYLKIKRSQAILLLEYLDNITVRRSYGRNSMPEAEVALRENYFMRMRAFHHPQRLNEQPLLERVK